MTNTRKNLYTVLSYIQNNIDAPIDIMTITGCGMTDDEIAQHAMRYAKTLNDEKQSRLVEIMREINSIH